MLASARSAYGRLATTDRATRCAVLATLLLGGQLIAAMGCAQRPEPVAGAIPGRGDVWVRSELYFGLTQPDGSTISKEQWGTFWANEVLPRFPDGLTTFEGKGQWRDKKTRLPVVEASRIVVILHPDTPEADARLEEIRRIYLERFSQQSVLRVSSVARVSF